MAHTSAATFLVWSVLGCGFSAFLVFHLWNFDRFKCLKWNSGPYSGAFKRIMTYTYLVTIPFIMVYSVGFAVIKYKMGYSFVPGHGIIPTPWQLWPHSYQRAIFPLQLILSIGWSFEMVTHLEELCFWLFLINAGSVQQDWFRSLYFKVWVVGSCIAVTYMPLVTIFTRSDPLTCEAFSFLAGSLGGLLLTFCFMPVLWTFPSFLKNLRKEGVDMNTIVRLTTFYELNTIRVVFRFLFVAPLLVLGVDGARPHQHINESGFWTELLTIIGGIGCVVSSGLTLVIFFPRNRQSEITTKYASKDKSGQMQTFQTTQLSDHESVYSPTQSYPMKNVGLTSTDTFRDAGDAALSIFGGDSPNSNKVDSNDLESGNVFVPGPSDNQDKAESPVNGPGKAVISFSPNRRADGGKTLEGGVTVVKLTEENKKKHDRRTMNNNVHPLVHNFTSPIDLVSGPVTNRTPRGPRYRG